MHVGVFGAFGVDRRLGVIMTRKQVVISVRSLFFPSLKAVRCRLGYDLLSRVRGGAPAVEGVSKLMRCRNLRGVGMQHHPAHPTFTLFCSAGLVNSWALHPLGHRDAEKGGRV